MRSIVEALGQFALAPAFAMLSAAEQGAFGFGLPARQWNDRCVGPVRYDADQAVGDKCAEIDGPVVADFRHAVVGDDDEVCTLRDAEPFETGEQVRDGSVY